MQSACNNNTVVHLQCRRLETNVFVLKLATIRVIVGDSDLSCVSRLSTAINLLCLFTSRECCLVFVAFPLIQSVRSKHTVFLRKWRSWKTNVSVFNLATITKSTVWCLSPSLWYNPPATAAPSSSINDVFLRQICLCLTWPRSPSCCCLFLWYNPPAVTTQPIFVNNVLYRMLIYWLLYLYLTPSPQQRSHGSKIQSVKSPTKIWFTVHDMCGLEDNYIIAVEGTEKAGKWGQNSWQYQKHKKTKFWPATSFKEGNFYSSRWRRRW